MGVTVTTDPIKNAKNIGTMGTDDLSIGTNAVARTITIGNDASTKVDVNALAIELDSAAAMTLSSVGALDIDTVGTAAINIGTQSAAKTITIGNTTAGSKTIMYGDTYPDDGANVRPLSPPRSSATIATFNYVNGGADHNAGSAVVPIQGGSSMSCERANGDDADDHVIGILASTGEGGTQVKVQIGGIMKAICVDGSGAMDNGHLCKIDATGRLESIGATVNAAIDSKFIIVHSGTSGENNSLVMWLRGENF